MANLDLNIIWELVKSKTAQSGNRSLSQTSISEIAQKILGGLGSSSSASSQNGGLDISSIVSQIGTLVSKFQNSSDATEKSAATNLKSVCENLLQNGNVSTTLDSLIGNGDGKLDMQDVASAVSKAKSLFGSFLKK